MIWLLSVPKFEKYFSDPDIARFIPNVIEQCSTPRQLVPSLLFPPIDYLGVKNWQHLPESEPLSRDLSGELLNSSAVEKFEMSSTIGDRKEHINRNFPQYTAETLVSTVKEKQESLDKMQEAVKEYEENLLKVRLLNITTVGIRFKFIYLK